MKASLNCHSLLICLGLIVLTLAVYWQVLGFDFTYFDDDVYVSENRWVLQGLTSDSLAWALGTTWQSNWHPATWLSLMLDAQISEDDPARFHATNLILHTLSVLLLFWLLAGLTKLPWRSGFVAALFAIHPLHVESVAWVAERKDVLSTVFWMLTLLAYVSYAKAPSAGRYAVALVLFALGLTAKPMLVTLPLVLLLLDYWPLSITRPLRQKLPFLALSLASCAVTIWAQAAGGSVASLQKYSLGVRTANAAVSYVAYIGKMLGPRNLAVFYPHPGDGLPTWQVAACALGLAGVTVLAVAVRKTRPYVFVGWLWYLVTLVPVIGLVQVGMQAMADRYTYVPLIGLFIAIAWLIPDLVVGADSYRRRRRAAKWLPPTCATALILAFALTSYVQVGVWRDSRALFRHAIAVTTDNDLAYGNFAYALYKRGDWIDAIGFYHKALAINPDSAESHNGLGTALARVGHPEEAVGHFRKAIELGFARAEIHSNLGSALMQTGDYQAAIRHYTSALRMAPSAYGVLRNRALAYARLGDYDQAARDLKAALRYAPNHPDLLRELEAVER